MKRLTLIILNLALLFLELNLFAQHSETTAKVDKQMAERMQWFSKAKLGIFIHWGIYSKGLWSESWAFHNKSVSYEDYFAQCKDFTVENYKPEQWAKLIKESGAKYAVITSKHHDGFAIWDTKIGTLSSVKSSASRKDVLTPFVKEIKKIGGIKTGIYFSLIDWYRDDYPNIYREGPPRYDINKEPKRWQHFLDFNNAQLRELQENYNPDLIWFDGDWEFSAEQWKAKDIVERLRAYNPKVIVNSRIQGYGDYATPELGIPVVHPSSPWWETCMTINDSWGYKAHDTNYKSLQTILMMLVDCISKGGNLLLDISPRADGTIPQPQVDMLQNIGKWIKKHEEAIYSTHSGIPEGHVLARTSLNETNDILYIYIPYTPNEKIELKGIKNSIKKIRLVGTEQDNLHVIRYNHVPWSKIPGVYYIDVPREHLDKNISVIAIELDGPLELYRGEGQVISYNQ